MYPKNAPNPLREEAITGELEPTNEGYAIAKIMTAKLCEYISKVHGDQFFKTIIPCNLYGRYDKFDEASSHMIPAVIKKIYRAWSCGEASVEIWVTDLRDESLCTRRPRQFSSCNTELSNNASKIECRIGLRLFNQGILRGDCFRCRF